MPERRLARAVRGSVGLALLLGFGNAWLDAQTATASQRPRLLVVVVVDQLRADYLDTFSAHWRAGIRTLLSEGALFTRAAYPYFHADTCAGHSTIGTGAFPRTHGMVANNWWDTEGRRTIECTDDDQAEVVTYGRASKMGKSGKRIVVPTLADELRTQRPGSRVVTLSMKARSAIGLAGHGGDAVTWFDETAGVLSFLTSRAFAAGPVPAVRAFLERHPPTAEIGRSWTLRDPAGVYRYRDAGVGERPPNPWTGLFPHEIKAAAPPTPAAPPTATASAAGRQGTSGPAAAASTDQAIGLWRNSPFTDAYLGRMAAALVDDFEMGRRQTPDFLGIGLSATDAVGHAFGPESREVEDTVARLDDTIGALIAHLDAKVGRANYVLALSSDHGTGPVPVTRGAGRVATEDVRERIEETLTARFGALSTGRYVLAAGTSVKLADGVMDRLLAQPAVMRELIAAVTELPGVDRVLPDHQLSERASDPVVRAAALSRFKGRSGDLLIVVKPNWHLVGRNASTASTHGTPYPYDAQVPVILFGNGIKPGRYPREVTPADIAPTLARLAGVSLPKAEGRVLQEALR